MTTESILTWVKSHSEEETLSLIASGEELYGLIRLLLEMNLVRQMLC